MHGNWVDICCLAVSLWFAGSGLWMGLTRSLFRLLSLALGTAAAWFCTPLITPYIQSLFSIESAWVLKVTGASVLFLGAMGLTLVLGKILQKIIRKSPLSFADRIGGLVLGILKSLAINSFLLSMLAFLPTVKPFSDWQKNSTSFQIFQHSQLNGLKQVIGEQFQKALAPINTPQNVPVKTQIQPQDSSSFSKDLQKNIVDAVTKTILDSL